MNDLAPDERRGEAISYYTLSIYAGLALGPLAGELALDERGFDAVWLASGVAGAIGALAAAFVRETRGEVVRGSSRARLVHPAAVGPGLVLLASR